MAIDRDLYPILQILGVHLFEKVDTRQLLRENDVLENSMPLSSQLNLFN